MQNKLKCVIVSNPHPCIQVQELAGWLVIQRIVISTVAMLCRVRSCTKGGLAHELIIAQ